MKKSFILFLSVCALLVGNKASAAGITCGEYHVYVRTISSYQVASNYSHTHYSADRNGNVIPMNCIVTEIRHYDRRVCSCGASTADVLVSVDPHHSVN